MANKKYFSFLFTVPDDFMSSAVRVITQYEINVRYALLWNKKVEVEGYTVKPGMAQRIVKWEELEQQIQLAAENNSKQYKSPGEGQGQTVRPEGIEPYNDIHDEWKREIREKELHGW